MGAKDGMEVARRKTNRSTRTEIQTRTGPKYRVCQSWLSDPGRVTKVKSAHFRARLTWASI